MKANVEKQRRPDFIYALVFIGDTIAIVQGLIIGFYLRFTSGLIPLYETSSAPPELDSYLTLFGFGVEGLQLLISYRTADWIDIAASSTGIIIGLAGAAAGLGGWGLRIENWYSRRTRH